MDAKLIQDNTIATEICSGAGASEMNKDAKDHGSEVSKLIPSRRIGTDEDMAGIAVFLASRAGDYVVGNSIAVDGGIVYANLSLPVASE